MQNLHQNIGVVIGRCNHYKISISWLGIDIYWCDIYTKWCHVKLPGGSTLNRSFCHHPELKLPFTLRRLSTASETMCACCRLASEDGFREHISSHCQSAIFQTIIVKWHGTERRRCKRESGDGNFINIYFHRKPNFSLVSFSTHSLPALFIIARPKNKSSLLLRIFGGLSFVNLVNPPSKHCLIMSLKLFQNIDMCFPPSQQAILGGSPGSTANERRAAQNHLSEDWHWSFSTGSSEYWFGFNQSSEWGNMTHTQTLMMPSRSIYSVLITFGAESRFVLCYKIPGHKTSELSYAMKLIHSISVMAKSESTSFRCWWCWFGDEDRRLGIVCLLIKFAQGNFIIFDVLWRIFRWHRFPELEVTLFERDYDKIFHSFGYDLEGQVAKGGFRQKLVLGFKFLAMDRHEIVVQLKVCETIKTLAPPAICKIFSLQSLRTCEVTQEKFLPVHSASRTPKMPGRITWTALTASKPFSKPDFHFNDPKKLHTKPLQTARQMKYEWKLDKSFQFHNHKVKKASPD